MWTRAHSSPEENYEIQPRDVFFSVAKSLPVHNPNSIHKYDDKSWRCEPGAGRQREAYQLGRRRRPDQPLCRKHLWGQSVTRQWIWMTKYEKFCFYVWRSTGSPCCCSFLKSQGESAWAWCRLWPIEQDRKLCIQAKYKRHVFTFITAELKTMDRPI